VLGEPLADDTRSRYRWEGETPRITVATDTATVSATLWSRHWSAKRFDDSYTLKLSSADVVDPIPGVVALRLAGLRLESVSPLARIDDGQARVEWALPRAPDRSLTVVVSRERLDWLARMRAQAGWFRLLYPPVAFVSLLVVFAVAWAIARGARNVAPAEAAWLSGVAKVGAWVALGVTATRWLYVPQETDFDDVSGLATGDWHERFEGAAGAANLAAPAAIGALLLVSAAVVLGSSRRRTITFLALLFAQAIAFAAILVADAGSSSRSIVEELFDNDPDAWLAATALAVVITSAAVGYGALASLSTTLGLRAFGASPSPRASRVASAAGTALGAGIAGHWAFGAYVGARRDPSPENWIDPLLRFEAAYAGLALATAFFYVLQFLVFPALLVILRSVTALPGPTIGAALARWARWAVALIFAAFVVGTRGWIDRAGLPLPLPFAVSLVTIVILTRHARGEEAGISPSDWWARGVSAARLGLPIAVIPFAFYAYLILRSRLGAALELDASANLPFLIVAIVGEATSWVAAAVALGLLRPYLPGVTMLQGLFLAALYAVSIGVADLFVAGIDPDWPFRALVIVVFYVALAVRIDYAERPEGETLFDLLARYPSSKWRPRIAYAAPAVLALAGIFQQLYAGDVSGAGRDIFTSLRLFIPDIPPG
jgi:hypothetical protein